MDGYLRLILLAVATVIVFCILFQSWYRRRQLMKTSLSDDYIVSNPDTVLGLDAREPTIDFRNPAASSQSSAHRVEHSDHSDASATKTSSKQAALLNDLIVITVVAQPDSRFESYDLLQAITATGMQFGDMNIFHYMIGNEKIFSLASATEPGDFNLDRIGDFSCTGLTLFANLREVSNPEQTFAIMLRSAEQLAEDLNGELRAGTRKPWTEEAFYQLQDKVSQFQLLKQE